MTSLLRVSCAFVLGVTAATAQTGRSISLGVAPGLGVTSTYTATYPVSAAGRFGFFLLTLPEVTAQPLVLPGFTSNGLVRVDLNNQLLTSFWPLNGTGSQSFSVPIPMDYVFQGFSFDVQTVDVDFTANDLAWADNDLELTIGQGLVGQGLNMVRVPAGTFQMGSPVTPLNAGPYFNQAHSQPVHPVTISRPFWIGKYEVTQAEYQAVMGSNPSFSVGAQRPVEIVTWLDAAAYCTALTAIESGAGRVPPGYQYRLPTEAEWEYCYRGGTSTEYWFGSTLACTSANIGFNHHTGAVCPIGQTSVVGNYAANPFGIHDMEGNVLEWCLDAWDFSPNYPSTGVTDPFVSVGPVRVLRGGCYSCGSNAARAAHRDGISENFADMVIGFRVVLAPIQLP